MYNVSVFLANEEFRREVLATLKQEKRHVVFQMAGRDPALFAEVAEMLKDCESITHFELNLGCAQAIAERAGYGSYLEDETLISAIFTRLKGYGKALSAKLRFRGGVDNTRSFVKFLVEKGCQLISLHARESKERLGCGAGDCEMEEALTLLEQLEQDHPQVQFVYNGGIFRSDQIAHIHECNIGVMCGEALLSNPLLFVPDPPPDRIISMIETTFEEMEVKVELLTEFKERIVVEEEVNYRFHNIIEPDNIFQSMYTEKVMETLKTPEKHIVLFDIPTKILQIKSLSIFLKAFWHAVVEDLEWSTAALISHSMGVFGRDLMRLNVDLRELIVGKQYRSQAQFEGENGLKNWTLYKLEAVAFAAERLVIRLQQNLGVLSIEEKKKEDEL